MIEALKPYAEYKESGVPWLGQIPKHWDVKRFKYLLSEINTRSLDGHEQLLRVSQYTGVTPRLSLNGDNEPDTRAESLVGYKQVAPGDLVINIMLAWNGSLGVARSAGIVSPAYCVYRFNNHAEPWYYHNLLRLPLYKGRIKIDSTGVVESRLRLYSDELFRIEAILPGREEQTAIAHFVEAFGRRIDLLIHDKRRLIELLNEQKQVLINRAMTQGIDPNVNLRLSCIPWLRDLPSHWSLVPIKRLLSRMDYGTSEASNETGSIRVLTMGNIQKGEVILPRSGGLDEVPDFLLLEHGDLLFTRTNGNPELVGKVGIFRGQLSDNVSFASYLVRLRVKKPYNPQWLHLLLNSASFWPFARSYALVNLQTNLNSTRYGQFLVPVPPPSEQIRIVEWIGEASKALNATIARAECEIALLREFRTRLISDVVTGKLDVRGVELPAIDEAEVLEDIEIAEETEAEDLIESEEVTDADE